MGFTIQDMMIASEERYQMKYLAGKNGWSNSISWVHLIEDTKIIRHFWGKGNGRFRVFGESLRQTIINGAEGSDNAVLDGENGNEIEDVGSAPVVSGNGTEGVGSATAAAGSGTEGVGSAAIENETGIDGDSVDDGNGAQS